MSDEDEDLAAALALSLAGTKQDGDLLTLPRGADLPPLQGTRQGR